MTATRRHILRRIHRETGRDLRQVVRENFRLTAAEIARRYLAATVALAA
jgi:hypothetical protein